jgi:ABC-2 type transport system ATP-binding protein
MIRVDKLTKRFAKTLAVDNLSFQAAKGEVLGFLGPNGAGKTTTMRILTCYLPPTSGTVTIAGLDTFKDSLQIRKITGYLPESVPLYTDMRVREYLTSKARLYGLSWARINERLTYVLEKCRITDVAHRIIGQLSKGYRQRVGLAGALIHDPHVLILDEPTVGLDPNQIRETRNLIKELGRDRTILLSTHILAEIEAVCQRVIILDKGRLVAMDTPENLIAQMQGGAELIVEVRGPADRIIAGLRGLPGVLTVQSEHSNGIITLRIQTQAGQDLREQVSQSIVQSSGIIRELRPVRMRLEDIFAKITGDIKPNEMPMSRKDESVESHTPVTVS